MTIPKDRQQAPGAGQRPVRLVIQADVAGARHPSRRTRRPPVRCPASSPPHELRRGSTSSGLDRSLGQSVGFHWIDRPIALVEPVSLMICFRHILVVCEDSPNGDLALFTAAGLAEQTGAKFTVAAIADIDMPGRKRCCGSGAMSLNFTEREDADDRLRRAALLLTDGPDAEFVTGFGPRAKALIGAAAEHECDLIVVPASPRSRVPGLSAGDDAPRLRKLSKVPILQTPPAAARSVSRRTSAGQSHPE
jgi:nucleotide-binding universal stress UspA family protein